MRTLSSLWPEEAQVANRIHKLKEKVIQFGSGRFLRTFVDDFIEPRHRLEGVRIDTEYNFPYTIKTRQIRCENTLNILGQLKSLNELY